MGQSIGRCISAVLIRWCSAGICKQWLVAKWLGLVLELGLGLGPGNGILFLFLYIVTTPQVERNPRN